MTTNNTQIVTLTSDLNDMMVDYVGCVEAFKQADAITGQSFVVILNALTAARKLYEDENNKSRGFLQQFEKDTGRSYTYLKKLNRISNLELGAVAALNLGFNKCFALLSAPDDLCDEIVQRAEAGEDIAIDDIKQQVASAKAALSPEALEELKEDTRKEDRRIAETKKKEREAAVLLAAEEYTLEEDYAQMLKHQNTVDDEPTLITPETITDAEYEEVPEEEFSEDEQDTYDQIKSMFQHCMPWAPSRSLAIKIVTYIVDQYSLNLSEIIHK